MRGYSKAVLAFGLVAALSTPAWAQQGRGGFGGGMMMGGMGGANLLMNSGVQKELKLDEAQIEKAKGVAEELQAKNRDAFGSLRDLDQAERVKKLQELTRTSSEETVKALAVFLKPEQLKRFKEISLQQRGVAALADDTALAKKLKVSDEQVGKILAVRAETMTTVREAMQSGGDDRAAAMEKVRSVQKEAGTKYLAVLTDDQKKEWKELTGEPFEVRFEGRPGGPGGGRRRNNNN